MGISAKEAAEQVGMTKQGIIRACRSGKISAQKNVNGEWEIEPVELFRVYKPVSTLIPTDTPTFIPDQSESLQEKVTMLERMVADKDETIRNLFDALNKQQSITLMLEDKQQPRSWWQRLWGK